MDVTGLSAAEQNDSLEAHLRADRHRGFDISKPPLIRVAVFLVSDDREYARMAAPSSASSTPLSCAMILKEVFAIYEALVEEESVTLDDADTVPDVYRLAAEAGRRGRREILARASQGFHDPYFALGRARSLRSSSKTARDATARRKSFLPPGIRPVLKPFAKENGFTLYTCFQAAWAIILGRYSGCAGCRLRVGQGMPRRADRRTPLRSSACSSIRFPSALGSTRRSRSLSPF